MENSKSFLPHWDMDVVYPGLDSDEFKAGVAAVEAQIGELETLIEGGIDDFDTFVPRYNATQEAARTLGGYVSSFVATDSRNTLAQARLSELQPLWVRLAQIGTKFTAWVGAQDVDALIAGSTLAAEHAYPLRRMAVYATHQMSPAEEALATEMGVTGGGAWARLHGNLTSQIEVHLPDGRTVPTSVVRALANDADPEVRKMAYAAELDAWKKNALPLAAALNSIKGETILLTRKRGWDSPLDLALFGNGIDREILDAMLSAARKSFPDFRRYLRAKARHLGSGERLPWYDLFAPVGGASDASYDWPDATTFITRHFRAYSDKMGDFAERTFRENWIDAEPRAGKRDGAFCMSLRADESRIMMNYKPAFGSINTLAHELGHAYHNLCLADRTALQRGTPMSLAETASIFCETLSRQAALASTSDRNESLSIIEGALQSSCQVVVDITSRFLFESAVFDQRRSRELSVDEFCERMLDSQRQTYGDGLDESTLHPYMWAVKGHYYGAAFYNYPYMFGLLFGLGLYARYQQDPDGFKAGYDDLLSSTGLFDAATLGSRFGIDIRTEAFWKSSLDVIVADIDRFESLL